MQTLAGVLLPSATVFLLLLCNDQAVLGPWVNSARLNLLTGAIIVVLLMLPMILTVSVLFPGIDEKMIAGILIGGSVLAVIVTIGAKLIQRMSASANGHEPPAADDAPMHERDGWRMPPLDQLPPAQLTPLERVWLIVLRGYLLIAAGLVLARFVMLTIGNA